jgi:hypothetical protein
MKHMVPRTYLIKLPDRSAADAPPASPPGAGARSGLFPGPTAPGPGTDDTVPHSSSTAQSTAHSAQQQRSTATPPERCWRHSRSHSHSGPWPAHRTGGSGSGSGSRCR